MERESPTGRRRGGSVRVILLPVIALASVIGTSTLTACLKVTSRFTNVEYLSQAEILSMQQHDESVVLPAGFDVLDIGASKGNGSSIFLATALQKHSQQTRPVFGVGSGRCLECCSQVAWKSGRVST